MNDGRAVMRVMTAVGFKTGRQGGLQAREERAEGRSAGRKQQNRTQAAYGT